MKNNGNIVYACAVTFLLIRVAARSKAHTNTGIVGSTPTGCMDVCDFSALVFLSFLGWGETESSWYVGH
jgi:hypothetical protein